jgi:pimeloyl-ACP methyl ester carboxylesterase
MFIQVNGQLINVVSFGTGSTLLAHGGWTGSWELWQQPFELLSRRMRTVAYDHRGTGATKGDAASITATALVSDLFGVMDALEIERCVLASESAGSLTTVTAAIERPERFSALVIVAGVLRRQHPAAADPFCEALRSNYSAAVARFVDACTPEPGVDHLRAWGRDILARSTPEQAVRLIEIQYGADLSPLLPQIRVPVLIVHGANDALVPVEEGRLMASLIPDSRLVILNNTGHVPTVTRPREVAGLIEEIIWPHDRGGTAPRD